MKKIIAAILLSLTLVGCENQALTDAAKSTSEQVEGQAGGVDMGDAAMGAVAGMMLGNMMSGGNSHHSTTIIKEKKVYVQPAPRPSTPYRSSSSSSSFRSFSGGRR